MAGAKTAGGAQADAQVENSNQSADVTVSGSGVDVAPEANATSVPKGFEITEATVDDPSAFKAHTMYGRNGEEKEASTLSDYYSLKFDGYVSEKPKKS